MPATSPRGRQPQGKCFHFRMRGPACVLTDPRQPRRHAYSAEFKLQVVREALQRPASNRIKPVCRLHPGIEPVSCPPASFARSFRARRRHAVSHRPKGRAWALLRAPLPFSARARPLILDATPMSGTAEEMDPQPGGAGVRGAERQVHPDELKASAQPLRCRAEGRRGGLARVFPLAVSFGHVLGGHLRSRQLRLRSAAAQVPAAPGDPLRGSFADAA